jgi:hypothetical protein
MKVELSTQSIIFLFYLFWMQMSTTSILIHCFKAGVAFGNLRNLYPCPLQKTSHINVLDAKASIYKHRHVCAYPPGTHKHTLPKVIKRVEILTASCLRSSFPDFASCLYLRPSEPRHSITFGAFIPFITLHTHQYASGANI